MRVSPLGGVLCQGRGGGGYTTLFRSITQAVKYHPTFLMARVGVGGASSSHPLFRPVMLEGVVGVDYKGDPTGLPQYPSLWRFEEVSSLVQATRRGGLNCPAPCGNNFTSDSL